MNGCVVRFGVVIWTPDLGPRIGHLFVSYARNKSGAQYGVTFLLPFWAPEIVVFLSQLRVQTFENCRPISN